MTVGGREELWRRGACAWLPNRDPSVSYSTCRVRPSVSYSACSYVTVGVWDFIENYTAHVPTNMELNDVDIPNADSWERSEKHGVTPLYYNNFEILRLADFRDNPGIREFNRVSRSIRLSVPSICRSALPTAALRSAKWGSLSICLSAGAAACCGRVTRQHFGAHLVKKRKLFSFWCGQVIDEGIYIYRWRWGDAVLRWFQVRP
jgi:hypothetical protein